MNTTIKRARSHLTEPAKLDMYLNDSIKCIIIEYFILDDMDRIPAEINTIATLNWYLKILKHKCVDIVSNFLFQKLCYCGKLKLALWVREEYDLSTAICVHHDYLGIKYFKRVDIAKSFKLYLKKNKFAMEYDLFISACITGNIELANKSFKQYMYLDGANTTISYKYIFNTICFNNHLDMAKWFVKRVLMQKDGYLFRTICELGHLDMAKWLVKEFKIIRPDVPEEETLAKAVRKNKHSEIVKWLEDEMGIAEGIRH